MVFRRFRALIPVAASVLLASAALVGVGVVTAGSASAAPDITICLANSRNYCADVEDSVNNSGQPIWLYSPAAGAKDYHWYEVPVPCDDFTCLCGGQNCLEFEDVQNPGLCLGVSSELDSIQLIGCELGSGGLEGGTARAAWIPVPGPNGSYLENFFLTGAGYLAVNGPLNNGNLLYPDYQVGPGGAVWEQWTGP